MHQSIILFSFTFSFTESLLYDAVLASYGGLYVFKSHSVLFVAWNKILVVYASKGLTMPGHYLTVLFRVLSSFSENTYVLVIICRISYDKTTLERYCGKSLVLKQQLCAFLVFLNMKKSCGIHLNWQVSQFIVISGVYGGCFMILSDDMLDLIFSHISF